MSTQADSASEKIHRSFTSKPWIQLVAGVVGMMMISSLQYAWTLFVPSFTGTFKWSLPAVQLAFTLFIVFMTYSAPLTGYLLDRFGTRLFFTRPPSVWASAGRPWGRSSPCLRSIASMAWQA